MIKTLTRHKLFLGIVVMIILAMILVLNVLLKVEEIPSKGVFVMDQTKLIYAQNTL